MNDNDPITAAKEGVSVITELIKAAGDTPKVKEAADNLGCTAVTLTRTINNALLPLAAVNFAFDKARAYFSEKFQNDLSEKAAKIPPENLIEPKASVAGPTLQGLAFTHEEPNLKDMFLNLLATSMDARKATLAHPAFVEIIKQLDSEDARLVRTTLQSSSPIPIIEIYAEVTDGRDKGEHIKMRHLLNLRDTKTGECVEDPKLPAIVDNWVRLGLVIVDYDRHLVDLSRYSWVEERPEYQRLVGTLSNEIQQVDFRRGIIFRTEFGKQFAAAVGLQ